ncbi:hypothetical protein BT63DRAFT_219837 [Microthyrium microscopicum]|uniref:Uncharacterized protein n=1 Tax=Microthyrium microscopicum TaxID=703497 RepID=A0A6A6UKW1_9PEZI|nr:hypothetical protein BT63DRAFT_219837 [Microthyrium microscopicum]
MACPDRSTRTFDEAVELYLQERKLLFPEAQNWSTISPILLSPWGYSFRTAAPQFKASFRTQIEEHVRVPAYIYSPETYEFMGFDQDTAWRLWATIGPGFEEEDRSYPDFMIGFLLRAYILCVKFKWTCPEPDSDAICMNDDWLGHMKQIGIRQELQDAIMLPEYTDIRLTASCNFWLIDTMRLRFDALYKLNDRGHDQLIHSKYIFTSKCLLNRNPRPQPRSECYTRLYHVNTHDINSTADADNDNELTGVPTLWLRCGDFSSGANVDYYTPQVETADRYACYAKVRSKYAAITIAEIFVPNKWLAQLTTKQFETPDTEWKEKVWTCRRRNILPLLDGVVPPDEEEALIIGPISKIFDWQPDAFGSTEDILDMHALKVRINGQEKAAVQWAFCGQNSLTSLRVNLKRDGWTTTHQIGAFFRSLPWGLNVKVLVREIG